MNWDVWTYDFEFPKDSFLLEGAASRQQRAPLVDLLLCSVRHTAQLLKTRTLPAQPPLAILQSALGRLSTQGSILERMYSLTSAGITFEA